MTEKEWFSFSELAGLPGLPRTRQGVKHKAESEGWQTQRSSGRGGEKVEISAHSLPVLTQEYLRSISDRAAATESPEITGETDDRCSFPVDSDPVAGVSVGAGITDESSPSEAIESTSIYKETSWWVEPPIEIAEEVEIKRQTWLAILAIYEDWQKNSNISTWVERDTVFSGLYTRGEIEIPKWIRSKVRTLSRATLAAKRIAYEGKQSKALASRRVDRPKS